MSHKHRSISRQSSWMHNLKYFMMIATACLVLLFAVAPAQGGDLTNKYCPVITNELAAEQFFVDYQDQRIYFCCNGCKKDFLNNPEAYLANLDSAVADLDESISSHDHDEGAHKHRENIEKVAVEGRESDSNLSHDHETDHGESSSLIGFAGKFHPMVTHFPIALILSALLFSILTGVLQIQIMDDVSVYCIYLAALTGIGTVLLGLAAGSAASYPSFLSEYFSWHRLLGIATALVTILTAYMGSRFLRQSTAATVWSYRIILLVNAILVGVTGHFGAMLAFGPDHFNF